MERSVVRDCVESVQWRCGQERSPARYSPPAKPILGTMQTYSATASGISHLLCGAGISLALLLVIVPTAFPAESQHTIWPWYVAGTISQISDFVMLAGMLLLPLIMAYRPEHPRTYIYDQTLQQTAADVLESLSAHEAQRYVAIVGAGPAGLRAAELVIRLNREVPEAERRKVLLFDRNPVLTGLGAYGIPPVHKQGRLKDGVVKQAQGVMHGLVGRREWHVFPDDGFLQVTDSQYVRFFPHTDVGSDVDLHHFERVGMPLIIATGAQTPRLPTDSDGRRVPGRHLHGIVSATSEFFRQIGTHWLVTKKGVRGLRYEGKPHDFQGHKTIMIYGGGNVASDAFMWAFRNTAPDVDVLLVYRGELHCMTNMSRPYYKPIDAALLHQRAASPVFTRDDILDVPAITMSIKERQRDSDRLLLEALQTPQALLHAVTEEHLVAALNRVLHLPDLVKRLPPIERGSFRLDLHGIHTALSNGMRDLPADSTPALTLARTLLEMEYPNELRRLHRANMFGLLTVEAYLDKGGHGKLTHVRLRKHRRGGLVRDRKSGEPVLLRSNVIERDNIMRHRYTKEKLLKWSTVPTEDYIELRVDCVIEAIGDVVQPLGDLELTPWQSLKADQETGRVAGRHIWVTGQALTQKGKVRDSYVSALRTVVDMGPLLYPRSWDARHLLAVLLPQDGHVRSNTA